MMSNRHKTYLAAARECVLDVGWRRTTLTDVARRAGVSRMTIYRAWPDMGALLADLMTQEWQEVVGTAVDGRDNSAAGIAEAVVEVAQVIRSNELFRKILDVDPEQVLPYLLQRPGRSQEAVLAMLESAIAAGQEAGTVRPGSTSAMARAVLLTAHGHTLSLATVVTDTVSASDLDAELRIILTRGLQP